MRTLLRTTSSLLLAAGVLIASTTASAQTTISTGPQYANEVYYDLADGIAGSAPLSNWDIGFQIQGFASSIITNGGMGVQLYNVPNKTPDQWAGPLDTTGLAGGWDSWHNSLDSWELGAFNMGVDYNTGSFGWGEYNMVTHVVSASTIYVIILPDGSAKKIIIDGLSGGTYSFRYADLDGSNEVAATLRKSDFSGKNFGYYSIRDGKTVDREPEAGQWDLVFGKYMGFAGPQMDIPYPVTGVRSNMGITVARVVSGSPNTVAPPDTSAFSSGIATIGYDWKTFAGSTYQIDDSLAFFVKDTDENIYRIVFTGFGGGASGDFVFNQQRVNAASVGLEDGTTAVAALYPSVAERGSVVEVVYSLDRAVAGATATIHDASGAMISSMALNGDAGMHRAQVTAPEASGLYFVTVQCGVQRLSRRLLVR